MGTDRPRPQIPPLTEYESAQHVQIGLKAGVTRDEIERVKRGPDDPNWDSFDDTLQLSETPVAQLLIR